MSANSHTHAGLSPVRTVEVADRVFAYVQPDGSWYINNTGFVVASSAVIGIDSCATETRTRALLNSISAITANPVEMLINTHHHGDHTNGNALLGAKTIIAQENCRTEMMAFGILGNVGIWDPVEWGELTLAPPNLTFTDSVQLWADDRLIEVTYVGQPAHTSNDSVVWLPEEKVLFCGDLLFNGGTPFLLMGSVTGAIEVLTSVVAQYPADVIVPGHGEPCDRSLIPTVVGYLEFVLDTARRGLAAGLAPLEVARETDLGEYRAWLDTERIVGNLHRAYADLGPTTAVDIVGALGDMVAYNGGRPLSCYA